MSAETDLVFPESEYRDRLDRLQQSLVDAGLDALIAFEPESVTYITGYWTMGYFPLQFAIVPAVGNPIVFLRGVEEYYFDRTAAAFADRVLWRDGDDAVEKMAALLRSVLSASHKVAVELSSWQLNAERYIALSQALGNLELVDGGQLVLNLRWIKSPAELEYQRKAARIAEGGMTAGIAMARAGNTEREFVARAVATMLEMGNDRRAYGSFASGERAAHVHGLPSDRAFRDGDLIHFEPAPCVRNYHARFMRTIKVGRPTQEELDLTGALAELQDKALSDVAPDVPAVVPDRRYREGIASITGDDKYPYRTFYGVGLLLWPNTDEKLEATPTSTWRFQAGMTLHSYMIVRGIALSETIAVTDSGYESLTRFDRRLLQG